MFSVYTIKLQIKLEPKALADPQPHFHNYVQSLLLKYSNKLQGIPLSYDIKGVSQLGDIYNDCPFIFCNCLIDFVVFQIKIGDVVYVSDNMILGNFECDKNGVVEIESIVDTNGVVKFFGKEVGEDNE